MTYRAEVFPCDQIGFQTRPAPQAGPYPQIEFIIALPQSRRAGNTEFNLGVTFAKSRQPRQQPARRKRWQRRDPQGSVTALLYLLGRRRHPIKRER